MGLGVSAYYAVGITVKSRDATFIWWTSVIRLLYRVPTAQMVLTMSFNSPFKNAFL